MCEYECVAKTIANYLVEYVHVFLSRLSKAPHRLSADSRVRYECTPEEKFALLFFWIHSFTDGRKEGTYVNGEGEMKTRMMI